MSYEEFLYDKFVENEAKINGYVYNPSSSSEDLEYNEIYDDYEGEDEYLSHKRKRREKRKLREKKIGEWMS